MDDEIMLNDAQLSSGLRERASSKKYREQDKQYRVFHIVSFQT